MKQKDLMKALSDYAESVKAGTADSRQFGGIKSAIRDAYDAGSIDKEGLMGLGKKVTSSFVNQGREPVLQDLASKIIEKGGTVGRLAKEEAPAAAQLLTAGKKVRGFGPLLGMLGAGAMAMGAGQKAMAGDIPGAALQGASIVDPTGIAGAANQVREHLQASPEDQAQMVKQDRLTASPAGLDLENSAIQDNEDYQGTGKFAELKKKLTPGT
jgi:hypothetical protein